MQTEREIIHGDIDRGERRLIARTSRVEHRTRIARTHQLDRLDTALLAHAQVVADHAGSRGVLLQASVQTAAARALLGRIHADVPDLAAGTERAVDDIAVHHHTTAEARSDGHHNHAAVPLRTAAPDLAHRRRIRVVHIANQRMWAAYLERLFECRGVDLDVGRHGDHTACGHRTRHCQADTSHEQHGLLHASHKLFDAANHGGVALTACQRRSWERWCSRASPLLVRNKAELDGGASDIDTDVVLFALRHEVSFHAPKPN